MGLKTFAQRTARGILGLGDIGYSFADNDHLADVALSDFLGALPGYVTINDRNAMKLGPVAAGVATIAGNVSRLTMNAARGGQQVPQAQRPSLLGQLERGVPMKTSLYWTTRSLIFQPHTWWNVLERDSFGWPMWGEWLSRSRVTLDNDHRVIKIDGESIASTKRIGRRPEDVIRFDSPLGEGLLANGGRIIQRALAIDLAAAKAEDSPIPAIELHNTTAAELDKTKRDQLLDDWAAARRVRGVAYTPKGIEVKVHGKPADALLIDGRKSIALEIVREMNLPAWAASTAVEGATMTYDNRQSRNWELVDLTLDDYMTAIAGRLSLPDVTPRGTEVTFDADRLTRPDLKTRFETYAIGKAAQFIDDAWIAAQEGWPDPEEAAA